MNEYEQFLEERKKGIGSSDIAAILGLNPYMTAVDVWLQKCKGYVKPENEAMKAGKLQEQVIAQWYEDEMQIKVLNPPQKIYTHPQVEFAKASPDRLFFPGTAEFPTILECKNTRIDFSKEVPRFYLLQLMWQLGVMELQHGELAWLYLGYKFDHRHIELDKELFDMMLAEADKFWRDYVITGKAPEPKTSSDILQLFKQHTEKKTVIAVPENYGKWKELLQYKEEEKTIKAKIEICETELKLAMKDAEYLQSEDGSILITFRKDRDAEIFDVDRFKEDYPDLFKQYTKTRIGGRRFLPKKPKK